MSEPSNRTKQLQSFAQRMIDAPTFFERRFAERLTLHGIKFQSQVVIEPYIVDFLITGKKLIIELDGISHKDRHEYDQKRDKFLRGKGYKVLRLKNKNSLYYDLNVLAGNKPLRKKKKVSKRMKRLRNKPQVRINAALRQSETFGLKYDEIKERDELAGAVAILRNR